MPRDADSPEERRAYSVIGAFFDVYNTLGFGLFEHLHLAALQIELRERGHEVAREVSIAVEYKGRPIGVQRLDMVVDGCLVVEGKSTQLLAASASRQLYNYLCITRCHDGILLHFGPEPKFHRVFWNVT